MSVSHPQHGDCRVLGTAAGLAAARRSRGAGGPEHPRVPLLCSAAFCPLKPGDLAWPQADLALVSLANPESQGSHCGQELRAGGTGGFRPAGHPAHCCCSSTRQGLLAPTCPGHAAKHSQVGSASVISWSCHWEPRAIRAKSYSREGTQDG